MNTVNRNIMSQEVKVVHVNAWSVSAPVWEGHDMTSVKGNNCVQNNI